MRIADILKPASNTVTTCSLEFFPHRNTETYDELCAKIKRMCDTVNPTFCNITWKPGGMSRDKTLMLSDYIQKVLNIPVIMHIACAHITAVEMYTFLVSAKISNIQNILIIRGDADANCDSGDFKYAVELVEFVREHFGSYFCIGVAGYPECAADMKHLKTKVDAGAEFIITQATFDPENHASFEKECRRNKITCPIVPGVMLVRSYKGLKRFTDMCDIHVHEQDMNKLERDDGYGIDMTYQMCKGLIDNGYHHLHIYTMNDEKSTNVWFEKMKKYGYIT